MSKEDPDASVPEVKDVDTMVYVFGDTVVVIHWASEDEAERVTIHPDRVSAIEELEASLQDDDPEGFAQVVGELEQANSVPWVKTGKSFVVPEGMTARFGELLALGIATCEGAGSDDPGELFTELTQGRSVFYGHFTDPSEAGFVCFLDHQGTATALIATNEHAGEAVLDAITGIVGGESWKQVRSELKALGDQNSEPVFKLNPPFSMMLLLGRATELYLAHEREKTNTDTPKTNPN